MRIFIAVEIDDETRHELGEEIVYLRHNFHEIRWVRLVNLHVTMKYLGDVEDNEIQAICKGMDRAAAEVEPFSLEVTGLGCFPDALRPRVVWAGCGTGRDEVIRLATEVDQQMAALQFGKETKAHHPHITIGRVKQPSHAMGIETIIADPQKIDFGCVEVTALTLFMSELKKNGPRYTAMYHTELGAGG